MNRNTKLFLNMAEKLDQEIERNISLFIRERSYLSNEELPEGIEDLKRENEERIKYLVLRIQSL